VTSGAARHPDRGLISCQATKASAWYGVGAPKNMRAETIDKLNTAINAATAYPKL
jgi:tripartite-type tricarboxylate transporter receptor subunit TctC